MTETALGQQRCDSINLGRIVEDIWTALELLPLVPTAATSPADSLYFGTMRIDGDCEAVVLVEMSSRLAEYAAVGMFGASIDADMMLDAVGEVTNQVSGGIKGLLPGECALHVPQTSLSRPPTPDEPAECVASWSSKQGYVAVHVWVDTEQRSTP